MRRIAAGLLGLLLVLGLGRPAVACTCVSYDPAQAVLLTEIIIDGVVTQRDPIAGDMADPSLRSAKMEVEAVWKGDVEVVITLRFHQNGAACGRVPPVGQKIRIGSSGASPGEAGYNSCVELPLDDSGLNRRLEEYKTQTDGLARQAQSGDRDDKLAFAEHLRSNQEFSRSMGIYESLSRQDPDDIDTLLSLAVLQAVVAGDKEAEATIAKARQVGAGTYEAQGKIARAEFEAFGKFDPGWKDWSGVENLGACQAQWLKLDNAIFDNARLRHCSFMGASLTGASFRGADLSRSDFGGAAYDCTTIFPDNFDPVAAGMINLQVRCDPSP